MSERLYWHEIKDDVEKLEALYKDCHVALISFYAIKTYCALIVRHIKCMSCELGWKLVMERHATTFGFPDFVY
jgi:hypothetical protein